jgi:hypothetical protein
MVSRDIESASSVVGIKPVQPYLPHVAYEGHSLSVGDLERADILAEGIGAVETPSALRVALRFLDLALVEDLWEIRILNIWIGLEALFGPMDQYPVSRTIAKRVACFLNPDRGSAADTTFQIVAERYGERNEIVHGMRVKQYPEEEIKRIVLETESILRTCLLKIIPDTEFQRSFSADEREAYLETLTKGYHPPNPSLKPPV